MTPIKNETINENSPSTIIVTDQKCNENKTTTTTTTTNRTDEAIKDDNPVDVANKADQDVKGTDNMRLSPSKSEDPNRKKEAEPREGIDPTHSILPSGNVAKSESELKAVATGTENGCMEGPASKTISVSTCNDSDVAARISATENVAMADATEEAVAQAAMEVAVAATASIDATTATSLDATIVAATNSATIAAMNAVADAASLSVASTRTDHPSKTEGNATETEGNTADMTSSANGNSMDDRRVAHDTETDGTITGTATESATNVREDAVALAAMQEAAAMVIEAEEEKKRKAEEDPTGPGCPTKKRAAPTRVSWEDRLKQLSDYKEKHGNLLIPIRYKLNPSLGKFVHNTREQYKLYHKQTPAGYKKKCSLTAERIRQLEALGFVWSTERTKQQNEDWQARLKQLKDYKEKHGHCLVPHGYTSDPSFAEWIHRQRTTYASMVKDTKVNQVVKSRMDQLRELGFNFTVHSDKWMDHWNQLKEYKEKHGDCQVPTHYSHNPKLGRWVHTQRHQRRLQSKGKKSCMTQDRIDLLDRLGFSWEVRPSLERPRATWQQRLEELTDYYHKHANFQVDPSNMPHLHAWCHEQRQRLKLLDKNNGKDVSKRMGPDRVSALKGIGFTKDSALSDKPVVATLASHEKMEENGTHEAGTIPVQDQKGSLGTDQPPMDTPPVSSKISDCRPDISKLKDRPLVVADKTGAPIIGSKAKNGGASNAEVTVPTRIVKGLVSI